MKRTPDFPDILHEGIDSTMDETFSEVDLAAIATEYEDILSRCSSFAKENLERSILEWLVCLRQFLRKHRKDIADYLPLDVQTRKSIQPNSDFSANRLVELKYQQGLGNGSLSDLLLTITDDNGICLDVAVYQTAGYLCFLKQFKYAIVTDSKEFVILEHKDSVTVVQRAKVNDIRMLMRYYSSLFMLNKSSSK
ncbi:uncharacterized protein LOC117106246 isoform X2 [Anneissia japonica]|uniref:uncharacterized protein LOC117106246 isoform X2 n=1 Tax=Anneissia japonica TaxID=1529436 RepID=UPI00142561D0|nr:uncharacterized protein LOC117106246 isoform X2 [Anneissia japonica]